ncbi:hypothetical protein PYW07_011396 [Mythimna separata]|uniref:Uncharacterized protein n=1 Tax=Mythimna separata TaxID=271217 RepID=A0AAD7Y9S6_MYTSE|nr:hypothetical protein PYW07_011396 [Mythimna separata]
MCYYGLPNPVYYSRSSQVSDTQSKMHDTYLGLTPEEFEALVKRYRYFQQTCDDLEQEPVKVFNKLSEKSLGELLLNRGVSMDLQKKKEEDMKKAAQAAAESKEEEEKKKDTAEEKTEENAEEKKEETEK